MTTMLQNMVAVLDERLSEGEHPAGSGIYRIEGTFDLREVARAVLLAIREPTYELVMAGHGAGLGNMDHAWRAMIDEILSERPLSVRPAIWGDAAGVATRMMTGEENDRRSRFPQGGPSEGEG